MSNSNDNVTRYHDTGGGEVSMCPQAAHATRHTPPQRRGAARSKRTARCLWAVRTRSYIDPNSPIPRHLNLEMIPSAGVILNSRVSAPSPFHSKIAGMAGVSNFMARAVPGNIDRWWQPSIVPKLPVRMVSRCDDGSRRRCTCHVDEHSRPRPWGRRPSAKASLP